MKPLLANIESTIPSALPLLDSDERLVDSASMMDSSRTGLKLWLRT
jgi:hypothetical protein